MCGWSAWPRMSRLIALGAVSCAPVMTAPLCPWFEAMIPVLSAGVPPPDGAGVGAGVLGAEGEPPPPPQAEIVIATPLSAARAAATVNSRRSSVLSSFMASSVNRTCG